MFRFDKFLFMIAVNLIVYKLIESCKILRLLQVIFRFKSCWYIAGFYYVSEFLDKVKDTAFSRRRIVCNALIWLTYGQRWLLLRFSSWLRWPIFLFPRDDSVTISWPTFAQKISSVFWKFLQRWKLGPICYSKIISLIIFNLSFIYFLILRYFQSRSWCFWFWKF